MRYTGVRVQTQSSQREEEDADSWERIVNLPACCWCCRHLGSFLFKEGSTPSLGEPGGEQRQSLCLAVVPIHPQEVTMEAVLQLKRAVLQLCP